MTVVVALEGRLPSLSRVDRWLHAGGDAGWRTSAEAGPLAGVPRVDVADALQRTAEDLRQPFLDWCGMLARRNDSLEWWATALASRSSYSRFYERICTLATALEALAGERQGTTLVVAGTPALAAEIARRAGAATLPPSARLARGWGARGLRAWTRLAPAPLRDLPGFASERARMSVDTDPRHRRRVLAARGLATPRAFGGPGTALLLTWVDGRSVPAHDGFADPHLGPLARLLQGRGIEVAYLPRVLHSFPFATAVARLAAAEETFLFPDAYLALDDHRACAARAGAYTPTIEDDEAVAGVPVAALARELVAEERSAQTQALLMEPLVRRLAEADVRPERIVHTYEGHPWELVLARAVRTHLPETELVGYDNLNMPRLALSMFPAPGEGRPLPDRLVTNGPAYADVLVAASWPADAVRTGCGLRHASLWDVPVRSGPPTGRILAATEIAPGPAVELVTKAAAAFGDRLVVKPHPLVPRGSLPSGPCYDERPLSELLRQSDVLLHTYSAVAFEALALGVPPVFVRSESTLDLDPLEFAPEVHWTARTPAELRAVADEIAGIDLAAWRSQARATVQQAIAPPSTVCVEAFL